MRTYRLQPQQTLGDRLVVEQEAAKEQGEEHDEHAEQVGHALVADDDSEEQADHRRCQVEEHEEEHEFAELGSGGYQTSHGVHDAAHDGRREDAQGNDVEDNFGQIVRKRGVVSLCALADEEQTLRREGGKRRSVAMLRDTSVTSSSGSIKKRASTVAWRTVNGAPRLRTRRTQRATSARISSVPVLRTVSFAEKMAVSTSATSWTRRSRAQLASAPLAPPVARTRLSLSLL